MTAQQYYDTLRKQGCTDDITSNPDPNYKEPFYQSIFNVMEGYARKYYEMRMREVKIVESFEREYQGRPNPRDVNPYDSKAIRRTQRRKTY
jgi:tyrosyl-tRNA synthetase